MASLGETAGNAPERLTTRDRWILAGLTVLAVAAALSAAWYGFWAGATFFGEQPTARENAVAGQAGRTVLWAVATPGCYWAVLRGGRDALAGAAVWLVLVVALTWWVPLPAPADTWDGVWEPLWSSSFGVLPWCLAGAGLAVGLVGAFRDGRTAVRAGAVAVAVAVATMGVASYAHLQREARAQDAAAVSR